MRFNLKLLVAFLPLVVGSSLNPYENSRRTNDASGVSVSLEDASTAPAAAAVNLEDHAFHQPRAAKTTKTTCPAKYKGSKSSKSSTKSKTGRWLSSLVRRNGDYGSLSVPTTANPLDKWATDIYKTVPKDKQVHVDFVTPNTLQPTSLFTKFEDSEFFMTLTGLYGSVMEDDQYKKNKNIFNAGVAEALKGIQDKEAEAAANKGMKKENKQKLAPVANFVPLNGHSCLHADFGAQAFIFTPVDNTDTTKLKPDSPFTVEALKEVVAEIIGLEKAKIATHTYKTPGERKARAEDNGEGKVLLTYSPNTGAATHEHAYQVHVKKTDSPEVTMAIGATWTGDANQCTCVASPLKVKEHDPGCCNCQ